MTLCSRAGHQLADHRMARQLPGDEQAAGGLSVGEEHQLVLGHSRVVVRADPVQVASAAAGHVAGGVRRLRRLDVGDRRRVDDRRHAAGPAELVQVSEQAEAGDVGGAGDAGGQRSPGRGAVEGRHHFEKVGSAMATATAPIKVDAATDELVSHAAHFMGRSKKDIVDAAVPEYIDAHRDEINAGIKAALGQLNGTDAAAVSLMTGLSGNELNDLRGMPK